MKKLRTRQHFIEDFGMNHIERYILHAHCTLQRHLYDYGYDAFINTYGENGECENKVIQFNLNLLITFNIQKSKTLSFLI